MKSILFFLIILIFSASPLFSQATIYVKKDAVGANDGSSWTSAFTEIQDALSFTANNMGAFEIWVAEGVYTPFPNASHATVDRDSSFMLQNNVVLLGGFVGNEDDVNQRNWTINQTYLSGLLVLENDDPFNPMPEVRSNNIVRSNENDDSSILDGFIITGGVAKNELLPNGGGIHIESGNPDLRNLEIKNNFAESSGGGIYFKNSNSVMENVVISDNESSIGGGVYIFNGDPTLTNLEVSSNFGGGIYIESGSAVINYVEALKNDGIGLTINSGTAMIKNFTANNNLGTGIFLDGSPQLSDIKVRNNRSQNFGGGILIYGEPNLINIEVIGNSAGTGGGLSIFRANPTIKNAVIKDNSAVFGGGGFNIRSSNASMTNVLVENNNAEVGGGIFLQNDVGVLEGLIISNNMASNGGGIYVGTPNSSINGVKIINNIADSDGGGIYYSSGEGSNTILNTEITKNEPSGISSQVSNLNIINTTLGHNLDSELVGDGQTVLISNSIIWDYDNINLINRNGDTFIRYSILNEASLASVSDQGNNITSDPYFVDEAEGDFRISQVSSAIDAGLNGAYPDSVLNDLYGYNRFYDGNSNGSEDIDMGSNEWSGINYPPPTVRLDFPLADMENISLLTNFEWKPEILAEFYEFELSSISTFDVTTLKIDTLTTPEVQLKDSLAYLSDYYWRVRAKNQIGIGKWSSVHSFTTVNEPPELVNLTSPVDKAVGIDVNTTFAWSASNRAELYRFQLSARGDFANSITDTLLTATEFISGVALGNDTVYYWRVRAENGGGESDWSNIRSFTTIIEAPELVILLSPEDDKMNVDVNTTFVWSATDRADRYRLQIIPEGVFTDRVTDTLIVDSVFVPRKNLDNGTIHFWRVRAENTGGVGEWSDPWSFTTIVEKPGLVVLNVPEDGAEEVEIMPLLDWKEAEQAKTYHLQLSDDSSFEAASILADSTELNDTVLSISQHLQPLTQYFWRVRASNEAGFGEWSQAWSFTTQMTTSINELTLPTEFSLNQNYPNPFNPATTIRFGLLEAGDTRLEVYNMIGQRVAVLVNGQKKAGWHQVSFNAYGLSSGLYIYRIQAGEFVQTRKMMLVK